MAFKSVPKANYDAGRDLIDQIPPSVLGSVLLAALAVLGFGVIKFVVMQRRIDRAARQSGAARPVDLTSPETGDQSAH